MTIREATSILTAYNKWRRGEPPYDGETPETHRDCPHSPKEIGEAIDIITDMADGLLKCNNMVVNKDWLEKHDALRLDKACEWIKDNFICVDSDIPSVISDFRNAMTE